LGALTPVEIARLKEQRIFSVDDLLRIARNAAGRNGLSKLNLQVGLGNLLDLASVLALPMLPAPVAESLLRIDVRSVSDFVQRDAAELARLLTGQLEQPIKPEDVLIWQQEAREFIALPLPSRRASQHNGHR